MTPAARRAVLELEFTRMKERADYLDRMLQGDTESWAGIQCLIPDGVELVIDKAVTEARQTALALASIAKTLAALGEEEQEIPVADPLQKIQDELKARRAAKVV